jgi:aspartate/methionine/tyrosine aminotransferase
VTEENVVVTPAASLSVLPSAALSTRRRVSPNQVSDLRSVIRYCGTSPPSAAARRSASFADIDMLRTSRRAQMLINSPQNPTGSVTPEKISGDRDAVREHDIMILSDESTTSILTASLRSRRCKACRKSHHPHGFSSLPMTGWRMAMAHASGCRLHC